MIVFDKIVDLLITNKGANLRVIDNNKSTPIDNYLKEQLKNHVVYLGSVPLEKYSKWHNDQLRQEYPLFLMDKDVSIYGDGSLNVQKKYSKKFKITIEEII